MKQPARFRQRRVQPFRADVHNSLEHCLFREVQHPFVIAQVPDLGKCRGDKIDRGIRIKVAVENVAIIFSDRKERGRILL